MSPRALSAAIAALNEELSGWSDEARRCADRGWHDSAQRIDREHVGPLTEARNWLLGQQMIQQHGVAAFLPQDNTQGRLPV